MKPAPLPAHDPAKGTWGRPIGSQMDRAEYRRTWDARLRVSRRLGEAFQRLSDEKADELVRAEHATGGG